MQNCSVVAELTAPLRNTILRWHQRHPLLCLTTMAARQSEKRVAYSPAEFAELFGKSQTWGYRQIYAGKVTAITQHGRILIPAKEVEKILESAGIYNGLEKPKKAKARLESLSPEQSSIWHRFLLLRRQPGKAAPSAKTTCPTPLKWNSVSRRSTVERLADSWAGKPEKS